MKEINVKCVEDTNRKEEHATWNYWRTARNKLLPLTIYLFQQLIAVEQHFPF